MILLDSASFAFLENYIIDPKSTNNVKKDKKYYFLFDFVPTMD